MIGNQNFKNEKEEKLEFLHREEIRTMQKDVARLRELEAQKERERIAQLKTEAGGKAEKEEKETKEKKEEKVKEKIITLIPRPPKKPASLTKVIVRATVVMLFLFIVSFFFWLFEIKKEKIPEEKLPKEEKIEKKIKEEIKSPEEKIPEIIIPPPLITVTATETQDITSLEEVPHSLALILEKKFPEKTFTRILFKNITENKILGLKDFFQAFEVKTPTGFFDKLTNDFTLFVYSSKDLNRLGFIVKIKDKEEFSNLVKTWEKTMEKDTEILFKTLGKKGSSSFPYFREVRYRNQIFRYISFPPANFGVCWSIVDDKFIFTSSGESMIAVINKISQ